MTCLFTPYSMAFPESYNDKMFIFDLVMNSLFFVEICMSFVTAYYNQNFELVDDVKVRSHANKSSLNIEDRYQLSQELVHC